MITALSKQGGRRFPQMKDSGLMSLRLAVTGTVTIPVDNSLPPAVATLRKGSPLGGQPNEITLVLNRGDTRHTLVGADNSITLEGY